MLSCLSNWFNKYCLKSGFWWLDKRKQVSENCKECHIFKMLENNMPMKARCMPQQKTVDYKFPTLDWYRHIILKWCPVLWLKNFTSWIFLIWIENQCKTDKSQMWSLRFVIRNTAAKTKTRVVYCIVISGNKITVINFFHKKSFLVIN